MVCGRGACRLPWKRNECDVREAEAPRSLVSGTLVGEGAWNEGRSRAEPARGLWGPGLGVYSGGLDDGAAGPKGEPSAAWAGNRTRASRVAGENSTTEPPMHRWQAPPRNRRTAVTACGEELLLGTGTKRWGLDGPFLKEGLQASCRGPGDAAARGVCACVCPRAALARTSGPCTFRASPGPPDRLVRCRLKKPGAGPGFALTGTPIRPGDLWLGGCLRPPAKSRSQEPRTGEAGPNQHRRGGLALGSRCPRGVRGRAQVVEAGAPPSPAGI